MLSFGDGTNDIIVVGLTCYSRWDTRSRLSFVGCGWRQWFSNKV